MLRKSLFCQNITLIISLLFFGSCLHKSSNQTAQIRIVDLNGNPRPIKRIIPEGNVQMLANQKTEPRNNINSNDSSSSQNISKSSTVDSDILEQQTNISQPQISTPKNSKVINNESVDVEVSYDMSDVKTQEIINTKELISTKEQSKVLAKNKKFKLKLKDKKKSKTAKGYGVKKSDKFIQIGFFSSSANAHRFLAQNKIISMGIVKKTMVREKNGYKVLLGPVSSSKKAQSLLRKAKKSGHKNAFITK